MKATCKYCGSEMWLENDSEWMSMGGGYGRQTEPRTWWMRCSGNKCRSCGPKRDSKKLAEEAAQ